jgi:hypothetical protein
MSKMPRYRIVKYAPAGLYLIERTGWFFWHTVSAGHYSYGDAVRAVAVEYAHEAQYRPIHEVVWDSAHSKPMGGL